LAPLNPDPTMTAEERMALLKQWHDAQAAMKYWTDVEMTLRKQVVDAFFADTAANIVDLGGGWQLSGTFTMRHDVKDSPELRTLVGQFMAHAETAATGAELLRWKPSLGVKAWKALPAWGMKLMVPHVTSKPNAPAIELLPPKA
jgi:hypothetical protein